MSTPKSVRKGRKDSLSTIDETESLLRGTGKDNPTLRRLQSHFGTEVNVTKELMEMGERWRELAYVTCPADGALGFKQVIAYGVHLSGWCFLVFYIMIWPLLFIFWRP